MMRAIFPIVLALLACLPTAFAESFVLSDATVHTVSGKTLSPGQVLVKDGKITAVSSKVSARDATVVDLTGLHLYPGLILPTSSLGLTEINSVRATQDTTEVGSYTPDVQAWIAVNPDSELLPVARANGITHFLAVPLGGVVSGQSGLMAMSGWSTEDMTVKKPVALHVFWPRMSLDTTPRELARERSKWKAPDAQAKDREKRLKTLDDFFKEAAAYAKARGVSGKKGAGETSLNPPWEAMLPFLRGELPLIVHAQDARQIKAAINWADANKYKIIIAGGLDAWMVAELLAKKKIPVIFESIYEQPEDHQSYDIHYRAPAVLQRAGVKVLFSEGAGSGGATRARNLPFTAAQAVAFGLPADEALKGITLYPAEALGVAEKLGSIETGKEASLFAADGDILDIRTNVKRMWIGGKEVSLDSRHTRLYEKYKSRPKAQ
ncbi:MAG: amidohydrolase family protein [Verrucomicrobiota bacterium]